MNSREDLIDVFEATSKQCREDKDVAAAVRHSVHATRLYDADYYPELHEPEKEEAHCRLFVAPLSTVDAASQVHDAPEQHGKKAALLNFASAATPGGGVRKGSRAQEESLCRLTALYPCLNQKWLWDTYYTPNRGRSDRLNTDVVIYSPDVMVLRKDGDPYPFLTPQDRFQVDVLTCAAPDLRRSENIATQEFCTLYQRRAEHILHVAAANHVEVLILGAFGCGAFRNDPKLAAQCWHQALEKYAPYFDSVIFAVYDSKRSGDGNFGVFKRELM